MDQQWRQYASAISYFNISSSYQSAFSFCICHLHIYSAHCLQGQQTLIPWDRTALYVPRPGSLCGFTLMEQATCRLRVFFAHIQIRGCHEEAVEVVWHTGVLLVFILECEDDKWGIWK